MEKISRSMGNGAMLALAGGGTEFVFSASAAAGGAALVPAGVIANELAGSWSVAFAQMADNAGGKARKG